MGKNWWLKWLGMTDWRLPRLHTSCPRPYPASAALLLPLQPSFDRKQEASRLVSVLSCVHLMTPTALRWQPRNKKNQKNKAISGSFSWSTHPPHSSPLPRSVSQWQQTAVAAETSALQSPSRMLQEAAPTNLTRLELSEATVTHFTLHPAGSKH